MLKNVKAGSSVTLANGLSATVTRIEAGRGWIGGPTTYFIKANNGKSAERAYNEAGKAFSGESQYNVTKVTSGFTEEKAKAVMGLTADELEALAAELRAATKAADGTEPKAIDFGDGYGPVMAARHLNGDGTYGGYVAETAFVADSVRVARGSCVFGHVAVEGTGRIINNSKVGMDIDFDNMETDTIGEKGSVTLSFNPLKAVA